MTKSDIHTRPREDGSYAIKGVKERTIRKEKIWGLCKGYGRADLSKKEYTYLSAMNREKGIDRRIREDLTVNKEIDKGLSDISGEKKIKKST